MSLSLRSWALGLGGIHGDCEGRRMFFASFDSLLTQAIVGCTDESSTRGKLLKPLLRKHLIRLPPLLESDLFPKMPIIALHSDVDTPLRSVTAERSETRTSQLAIQ